MNDIHDDRDPRLSHLLSDAVSDVEPQDALAEIRNRTKVTSMSARRPWLFAVGGAVVATAATVAAVAALGGSPQNNAQDPDPATSQTPTEESVPTEDTEDDRVRPSAHRSLRARTAEFTLPSYFVRDTPQGLRITREFSTVAGDVDPERGRSADRRARTCPRPGLPEPAGPKEAKSAPSPPPGRPSPSTSSETCTTARQVCRRRRPSSPSSKSSTAPRRSSGRVGSRSSSP